MFHKSRSPENEEKELEGRSAIFLIQDRIVSRSVESTASGGAPAGSAEKERSQAT